MSAGGSTAMTGPGDGSPPAPLEPRSPLTPASQPVPARPHAVERQLQARDSDRVYQAAGNQFVFERGPNRTPVAVTNTIPRDTAAFTGRTEEVGELVAAVTRSADQDSVIAIHAIDGMAGVGKTALAVHAAHLLEWRFPDGQMFLDLHAHSAHHSPVHPADALFALLSADGMHPDQVAAGLDARAAQWRARMAGRRVLLIMDNADGHAQVEPLLPGAAGCLVLITSRRRLTGLGTRHATVTLTLDTLRPGDAAQLFRRLIPRALTDAESQAVEELVQLCGYLPLAISLLAAKLRPEPQWTVHDLLDDLTTTHHRLGHMHAEDLAVAAAFKLSYRNLPAARRRFFRRLGLHPGTHIDAYAGAALNDTSPIQAHRHLEALYNDHLLDQPIHGRYRLHDLIGEYARDLSSNDPPTDREQAVARVLDYYLRAACVASRRIDPHPWRMAGERLVEGAGVPTFTGPRQAITWMRKEMANLFACVAYAKEHDDQRRIIGMSEALASFLCRIGRWRQASDLHRTAARAALRSGDHGAHVRALHSLGVVLGRTGDYAAAANILGEALAISRQVGDDHSEADILNELGNVYRMDGHFSEAADILRRALAFYQRLDDGLGQARALNNLAVVWWLADDFAAADEALQQALAIFRDKGELFGLADALFRLGVVRRMTADYPAAAEILKEAFVIYEDLGDRLGQANTRHNLAVVQRLAEDYVGAAYALDEALAIYRDLGDRRGMANAWKHLGIVRSLTGDLVEADKDLRQALRIYTDLGDRLGQASAMHNVGVVRRLAGDVAAATEALDRALGLYREVGNRLGQAEVLNQIAELMLQRGEATQALAHHQLALTLALDACSPLEEAHAIEGAARCALQQSDLSRATIQFGAALQIYRRIGSVEADRVAATLVDLPGPPSAGSAGAAS
jgi:tetratricopeptide (TPR) repeat protein